jgi:flavorubredoxin
MNINRITDRVTYCGVNDRTKSLFENLWELPYGVSYNSYFVQGTNATAIIDASDSGHAAGFIDHITELLPDSAPDYLIINHIEPDHSGAIPMLKSKYHNIKIVGNAKTMDMLKGFYGIEDNLMTVADGDTIDLGNCHLRFIFTPMVHWPETMMTYFEEERILFSGDAFGCFGALNGAVVDKQMDTEIYFSEAYRYYACIVAKYGQFVGKAFDKIAPLPMDYICSTHGPVWHEQKPKIIEQYIKMSNWEAEKGVVIAYGSMYGNTTVIAERLASRLADAGIKSIRLHDVSYTPQSRILADIMRFKGLILISPTYNAEIFPPVESLLTAILERGIKNRAIGVAGSYTWGSQAIRKIASRLEGKPVTLLQPTPQLKQALHMSTNDDIELLAANMKSELEN